MTSNDPVSLPTSAHALSPLQEGMLFRALYSSDPGVNVQQILIRLRQPVQVPAMVQAWQWLTDRHEVLRVRFEWHDRAEPVQVVEPRVDLEFVHRDLRALVDGPDDRGRRWDAFAQDERRRGFDLARAGLARVGLLQFGDDDWELVWTWHHAVLDGRSFRLLLTEVFAAYQNLVDGRDVGAGFDATPMSFFPFAQWTRTQARAPHRAYWRGVLAGAALPTPIPFDSTTATPGYAEYRGATGDADLSALMKATQDIGVTMNTLAMAAWAIVLGKWTGRNDVVFGATRAGRKGAPTASDDLVGLCINTVPVRARWSHDDGLHDWMRGLRARWIDMRPYEQTPLTDIQAKARRDEHAPLFHTLYVFEGDDWGESLAAGDGVVSGAEGRMRFQTDVPLTLVVSQGSRLSWVLGYDPRRFSLATVERVSRQLEMVLGQLAVAGNDPVDRISVLGRDERERVLAAQRGHDRARRPVVRALPARFDEVAWATPDAVALSHGAHELTYLELQRRADRVAGALVERGVRAEAIVGLHLERSLDFVVALLGVLKAGAAYLPLDPQLPSSRLRGFLADADAAGVIDATGESLVDSGVPCWALTTCEAHEPLSVAVDVSPQQLAYVLFTSGSTGRPKGVAVSHANVARLFRESGELFAYDARQRWSVFHSFSFDFSVWELWGALLHGGTAVLASSDLARDSQAFARWLREERITMLSQTPSAFAALLDAVDAQATWPDLATVVFGGEALDFRMLRSWFERHGDDHPRMINMYGITETTVHVTFREVLVDDVGGPSFVGHALPDLELYVLDDALCPVPFGVAGEIYVGGAGVARGYVGQAGLTASRFVPHPFAADPGERLYRSGDRGRLAANGDLEYLGRADQQVQVRGFRVEPAEVEAAIGALPGVTGVRVIPFGEHRSVGGSTSLVAYVRGSAPADLREQLRSTLPAYMIPSVVIGVERFPLTPNGKLDRQALPDPRTYDALVSKGAVPPQTPIERTVADLFMELLELDRVGRDDGFFELGGHSLVATRLVTRLRQIYEIELPLRDLFVHSTVAELATAVERVLANNVRAGLPVVRAGSTAGVVSSLQERLWFLQRWKPDSAAYNVSAHIEIEGPVPAETIVAAVDELLGRHEVLRTRYEEVDGAPVARVQTEASSDCEVVDLGGQHHDLDAQLLARARMPFDLEASAPVRVTLFRAPDRYHLLLVVHHIAVDLQSMDLILDDLLGTLSGSSRPASPELAYSDFVEWQRSLLRDGLLDVSARHWIKALTGLPVLELPCDFPRPPIQSHRGDVVGVDLGPELTRELRAWCQRNEITAFMAVLAAFQVALARIGGQRDFAVGIPAAGGRSSQMRDVVGPVLNSLAIRTDLAGDPTLSNVAARVKRRVLDAMEHADVPLEVLVERIQPRRNPSATPLFQTMFTMQPVPMEERERGNVRMSGCFVTNETSKFDLLLSLDERDDSIAGTLEFCTDLFRADTAARWADVILRTLTTLVCEENQRVFGFPLATSAERKQQLVQWNQTRREIPGRPLHAQFDAVARDHAQRVAVVEPDGTTITYRELRQQVRELATSLQAAGLGPEDRVALLLPRSADFVVSALAVLEAGGCYVPLDPAYPSERLTLMLADAQVGHGIHRASPLVHELRHACHWLDLGQPRSLHGQEFVAPRVHPERLAYIMFTSGSTGQPKGVAVPHRAVTRLVHGANYLDFGIDRTWLFMAPVSFDASTLEIWGALLHGARLVVHPENVPTAMGLARHIAQFNVDSVWLTAGLFHQIVEEDVQALASLRTVLAGGDVLSPAAVRRVLSAIPGITVINGYGPTENTTFSCCHVMRVLEDVTDPVSIGRPISNSQAYVLDDALRPLPVGLAGRLYVAGDGISRGYPRDARLTAARFVPNPYADRPGGRLYDTGDRARFRADGSLEFLGRSDHQVKIRGFRVEPGEVEVVLRQLDFVDQAVVVARDDATGTKQLVAYVTPDSGDGGAKHRAALATILPRYLIPTLWVPMDSLPLDPNGKVARNALPDPRPATAVDVTQPRDQVEASIREQWQELLSVDHVGPLDDFFDLGGHSLLATRLLAHLRALHAVEVTLPEFFAAPTVEELAARVRSAHAAPSSIMARDADSARELSPLQERLWFLQRWQPDNPAYNVPLLVELPSHIEDDQIHRALLHVFGMHEVLRTRMPAVGGEPRIEVDDASRISWQWCAAGDAQQVLARFRAMAREPFQLDSEVPVRVAVARSDAHLYVLILLHHIVADLSSVDILYDDLLTTLESQIAGRDAPPIPPVQYSDYSFWLRSQSLDGQRNYWAQALAGLAPLNLPVDFPRPAVQGFEGDVVEFELQPIAARALEALGRDVDATPFMVFLTVFRALLQRLADQDDFAVGIPVVRRDRPELERMVGCILNTAAIRSSVDPTQPFLENLARTRRAVLDALAHQDLPFSEVVDQQEPDRDTSRPPLAQVMFTLQDAPLGKRKLGDSTVTARFLDTDSSKFDLVFSLDRGGGSTWPGRLEFDRNLFERATVERWGSFLTTMARNIAQSPYEPLGSIAMAPTQQIAATVVDGQGALPPLDFEVGLVARFQAQVDAAPLTTAIVDARGTLSYQQLDERANAWAHALISSGVVRGSKVGICLPRSREFVVAVLAVLKAGAAYVPLDATYPVARLSAMIQDVPLDLVIVDASTKAIELPHVIPTLSISDTAPVGTPATRPAVTTTGLDLAYVMFTSGSTGRPKGTATAQQSVVRLVAKNDYFSLAEHERVLLLAPTSFDGSTFELWAPLLNGAALVIYPDEMATPTGLRRVLKDHTVSTLWLTAGLFHEVVDHDPQVLRGVRQVLAGGDVLSADRVERVLLEVPGCSVINGYGPTETTTFAVCHRMDSVDAVTRPVPIGRPIAHTHVAVLDAIGSPVPVGVPGELYIGGPGVARGYLGQAGLTAERFVPDPTVPGGRRYRTGDRVRWRGDRTLEFLGRSDRQVKVRGFRIEPGEVESVLLNDPAIKSCAVVVRSDLAAGRGLVAYVVADASHPASTMADVRQRLAGELPDFLVPGHIVELERLPLDPNGKLDRQALPRPPEDRALATAEYVAVSNVTEQTIAAVWRDLLGVAEIGAKDNFFDLGGNSLLMIQAQARLAEAFARELSVVELFQFPTIRSLARRLDQAVDTGRAASVGRDRGAARRALLRRRGGGRRGPKDSVESE